MPQHEIEWVAGNCMLFLGAVAWRYKLGWLTTGMLYMTTMVLYFLAIARSLLAWTL